MNNQNLYIHMQLSLHGHFIRYQTGTYELGNNLLDFIYYDMEPLLNDMTNKDIVIEKIKELHPYFSGLGLVALEQIIKNSEEKESKSLNIYKIKKLQEIYLSLIDTIRHYKTDEQTECSQYLFKYKLFSRSQFLTDKNGELYIDYFLMGFEDCLYIEFIEMLKYQTLIKKCKNCSRHFIPRKANIDYCSRVYGSDDKTCQEVGYTKTFAKSIKNDDLLLAYTRAYKAHYARMSKPRKNGINMSRESLKAWYIEAKEKLKQARMGELDADEFKIWLKQ